MRAAACNGSTIPSLAASSCLIRRSSSRARERRPIEPSLPLGASNDEVFGDWLGHSEEELAATRRKA